MYKFILTFICIHVFLWLISKSQFFVGGTKTAERLKTVANLVAKEDNDKANSSSMGAKEKHRGEKHETLADLLAMELKEEGEKSTKIKGKLGDLLKMEDIKDKEYEQLMDDMKENEQIIGAVFEPKAVSSAGRTTKGLKGMLSRTFSKRKSVKEKKGTKGMEEYEKKYQSLVFIKNNDPALSQVIEKLQLFSEKIRSGNFVEGPLKKYLKFVTNLLANRLRIPEINLVPEKKDPNKVLAAIIKSFIALKQDKSNKSDEERFLRLLFTALDDDGTRANLALEFGNKKKKRRGKRMVVEIVLAILCVFAVVAVINKYGKKLSKCFRSSPNSNVELWQQSGGWAQEEQKKIAQISLFPSFNSLPECPALMDAAQKLKLCAICLSEIESDEMVRPLPCHEKHIFHSECIIKWFVEHNTCPICRKPFTPNDFEKFAEP